VCATELLRMKSSKNDALNAIEKKTGLRFCDDCEELIPLSQFPKGVRMFKCLDHFRASRRRIVTATALKRAINSVRSRCHQDMVVFGHKSMKMGVNEIKSLLTPSQLEDSSKVCIIPRDPSAQLCVENAVAVSTEKRSAIMVCWRPNRDSAAYQTALNEA
jgi:hypothetical protein